MKQIIKGLKNKNPKSWLAVGSALIIIAIAGKLLLFAGIGCLLFTLYIYHKKGDLKW